MSTTQRLRPVERRVLRWADAGLDDAEIGRRFGRGERWTAQVRRLARLDVPRSAGADDSAGATDAAAGDGEGRPAGAATDAAARNGGAAGGAADPAAGDGGAARGATDPAAGDGARERAGDTGRREAVTRLRPLERRVLRWRAQGADHDELAPRFRRSPEFLARVEEYAHYKLAAG
jgi:DNA-binding CsgD family transcriptional regulator